MRTLWATRTAGIGAALASVVLVASCSVSVKSSTKSSGDKAATSTSAPDTTAAPTTTVALTEADLEKLLPTAAEVGPGFEVSTDDDSDDSDDDWEGAMKKACPELSKLSSKFGDLMGAAYTEDSPDADRSFTDAASRHVEVELSVGGDTIASSDQLDSIVEALNRCKPISVPDAELGGGITMRLHAAPDDQHGDLGMVLKMAMRMTGTKLPHPVAMNGVVTTFQRGQVSATVTAVDGLNTTTFQAVPTDPDLGDRLATELDSAIQHAQGD